MTYNLTSSLFIALFGFILFKEYHGFRILFAVILGFLGMLMIYKPGFSGSPWYYHFAGLVSGVTSALAYLTVGRIARYYDSRVIVLSFLLSGVILPGISLLLHHVVGIPEDGLLIIRFVLPETLTQWGYLLVLGLAALFGQYFVTLAYGSDKPGLVSCHWLQQYHFLTHLRAFIGRCISRSSFLVRHLLHHGKRHYHLP
jgi:drug/metabolite transporter (DMT)-like permease